MTECSRPPLVELRLPTNDAWHARLSSPRGSKTTKRKEILLACVLVHSHQVCHVQRQHFLRCADRANVYHQTTRTPPHRGSPKPPRATERPPRPSESQRAKNIDNEKGISMENSTRAGRRWSQRDWRYAKSRRKQTVVGGKPPMAVKPRLGTAVRWRSILLRKAYGNIRKTDRKKI